MPRSAEVTIVVWSLELLLSSFGSAVVELAMVAVLVSTPCGTDDATFTTRAIDPDDPTGIDPARVHVTTWPAAVHVQPAAVPETKVMPAGRSSVTWTRAAASDGPALWTARV